MQAWQGLAHSRGSGSAVPECLADAGILFAVCLLAKLAFARVSLTAANAEGRTPGAHTCCGPLTRHLIGHLDCDSESFGCMCRYYSSELHSAAFVLPAFARRELGSSLTF